MLNYCNAFSRSQSVMAANVAHIFIAILAVAFAVDAQGNNVKCNEYWRFRNKMYRNICETFYILSPDGAIKQFPRTIGLVYKRFIAN